MLCEECKVNEACYTVSVTMDGEVSTRCLCQRCMNKMHAEMSHGNIDGLLRTIFSAVIGNASTNAPQEEVLCPRCGTSLSRFTQTGRLGCPACYQAFHQQLQPMLQQIHGQVQHIGRRPLCTETAQRSRSRQEELSRQMAQAVAIEDFETAARLRDQLKVLAAQEDDA